MRLLRETKLRGTGGAAEVGFREEIREPGVAPDKAAVGYVGLAIGRPQGNFLDAGFGLGPPARS